MTPQDARAPAAPIGIICGAGALPAAVARAVLANGRTPVLFPLVGFADAASLAPFTQQWIRLGQFGRFARLAHAAGCKDVLFVGGLVRPAIHELRFDWTTIKLLPKIFAAYRGGDDHLLTGIGRIFERAGFRLVGIKDVAPEVLLPAGALTPASPDAQAQADIALGMKVLRAMSSYDIGQAVVVINQHVVAVEDIEGTDGLLARVARLRTQGRIRTPNGRGVLVKAPKQGQDLRFDLPTVGPKTIEGAAAAGLGGVAAIAGDTLLANPDEALRAAKTAGLFVIGVEREAAP